MFVRVRDLRDREQVGLLMEKDDGMMDDWAIVRRVCVRFNKWREWGDKGSLKAGSVAGRKVRGTLVDTKGGNPGLASDTLDLDQCGQRPVWRSGSRTANTDGTGPSDCIGPEGRWRTVSRPKASDWASVLVV